MQAQRVIRSRVNLSRDKKHLVRSRSGHTTIGYYVDEPVITVESEGQSFRLHGKGRILKLSFWTEDLLLIILGNAEPTDSGQRRHKSGIIVFLWDVTSKKVHRNYHMDDVWYLSAMCREGGRRLLLETESDPDDADYSPHRRYQLRYLSLENLNHFPTLISTGLRLADYYPTPTGVGGKKWVKRFVLDLFPWGYKTISTTFDIPKAGP